MPAAYDSTGVYDDSLVVFDGYSVPSPAAPTAVTVRDPAAPIVTLTDTGSPAFTIRAATVTVTMA